MFLKKQIILLYKKVKYYFCFKDLNHIVRIFFGKMIFFCLICADYSDSLTVSKRINI
jgi:hypothetical protein